MDIVYTANREEIRRFGHFARKVRAICPPHRLAKSFVEAVKPGAMAQPNRGMGKRCQEEWMEEDDLLGGELRNKICGTNYRREREVRSTQTKRVSRVDVWSKGIEIWRGLGVEGTSIKGDCSRADSRDNKGLDLQSARELESPGVELRGSSSY
jgi:hypothetical protein